MNTIGFVTNTGEKLHSSQQKGTAAAASKAVKSLVKVAFQNGQKFTYYNDKFDLKVGDIVFVEGSNEGQRGRVISLSKTFKIKLSDYKKVVSVADRSVKGRLFLGGSHLVSFEKETLPYEKVLSWMKAPEAEENEFVCVKDDEGETFSLDDLKQIKAWAKQSVISVAGGINESIVDIYMEAGADILIVGGGISHAEDPETAARNISAKVHR